MSLQTITNINVDFYDKKYILINAKQFDKKSRFLSVTCYNHGEICPINASEHSAYIRYKKSDGYSVLNICEINRKGQILVELTEQMLAEDGICYADLVIVNKGGANVDIETGEIVAIENASILSTMTFCIDVTGTAVANSEIESSYEYNGLNEALQKAEAEYTKVIQLAKSYAVGNAGGIRENEDNDNAKYYYELTLENANSASASAIAAGVSETNAAASEVNAKTSETNASTSENNAAKSEANAESYMNKAEEYMDSADASATSANESADAASESETNAINSANSATVSESNSKTYYDKIMAAIIDFNSIFVPMGTVEYEELTALVESGVVEAGHLYNISNDFITDETFKDGAGIEYNAGSNLYYTADGYWDCLVGATIDSATVDEVKGYLGIE